MNVKNWKMTGKEVICEVCNKKYTHKETPKNKLGVLMWDKLECECSEEEKNNQSQLTVGGNT